MALHRDIHWIGRQWAVTGHGMQLIDQKLQGFFDIEISQLWDDALIATTRGKEWLNGAGAISAIDASRDATAGSRVGTRDQAASAAPAGCEAGRTKAR